jgi:parallel beta-helix repeat protein
MSKSILKSRSMALLSILLAGAFLGTAFGAAMSVEAATVPTTTTTTPLTAVNASYIIYKDASGYTCAKNVVTSAIDYRDANSRLVIQKAIDKTGTGTILIKAGTYDITSTIYSCKTSITGEGNVTILKATTTLKSAVIMVTNTYNKVDGTRAMPSTSRPTGITISDLQIDGNRAVRTSGTMEGIGFINTLNSHVLRVYVHDVISGQGIYMSNSQYCTIKNSQVYNIGDTTYANYGSGIAFGEASSYKIASAYITIDNVRITKVSMSSIDLEPANHITITNCVFLEASKWNGWTTPAITSYAIRGYEPCDYNVVSGNKMTGAFAEFIILVPSNHSVVSNNVITYTAGSMTAIYAKGSHENKIIGNVIKTVAKDAIACVDSSSFTVSNNIVTDSTTSKSNYGIRFYSTNGQCTNNVISGNQVTGFKYGITAITGINHLSVTGNVIKSCTVGTFLKGLDIVRTPNVLNGAAAW